MRIFLVFAVLTFLLVAIAAWQSRHPRPQRGAHSILRDSRWLAIGVAIIWGVSAGSYCVANTITEWTGSTNPPALAFNVTLPFWPIMAWAALMILALGLRRAESFQRDTEGLV
ncbi:hypothetical protein [Neoactinobaculum massilliense]|uniref:hypothetical protein n=1 Tax=Neoactinobaculum massilliense TaxID=2364794 RepID=UPI000F54B638|nr:hypothetical protein [Neoactinobaculum massilliense]